MQLKAARFATRRPFLPMLPSPYCASSFADECRSAALGFIAGVRDGWGKREIAEWLVNSYGRLTIGPSSAQRIAIEQHVVRLFRRAPASPQVPLDRLIQVMHDARAFTVETLRNASAPEGPAVFALNAVDVFMIGRCIDEHGQLAWAPIGHAKMRLAERVLSLFAADCMMRPSEYESILHVCHECDSVLFDARIHESGECPFHRGSEIRLRTVAALESASMPAHRSKRAG